MAILTRCGFCESCYKSHRPSLKDLFAVIGNTGVYHIYSSRGANAHGITPHFYKLIKVIGSNVVVESICAMDGCGIDIEDCAPDKIFYFRKEQWNRSIITLEQWNSLVMLRDSGYQI